MSIARKFAVKATCAGLIVASSVAVSTTAYAASVKQVRIFGDSLSDTGNLFGVIGAPPAPYANGRFSNGPIWVDQLQARNPRVGYQSRAVGGALASTNVVTDNAFEAQLATPSGGIQPIPGVDGLAAQIAGYAGPHGNARTTAHVVWAGANDILFPELSLDPNTLVQSAVAGVIEGVQMLASKGAGNIVVGNLPDMGLTAFGRSDAALGAQLTAASTGFNQLLALELSKLSFETETVDIFALFNDATANPGDFGIGNLTDACFDANAGSVCSTPGEYLFWDDVHPTQLGQSLIADTFRDKIRPVPLPPALLMLISALAVVSITRGVRR